MLVDDASRRGQYLSRRHLDVDVDLVVELKDQLDDYVARFDGLVRIVRRRQRLGLIRAKLEGARVAVGEIVVFLDSHCEANVGWLEPLVARIKESPSSIVCPIIGKCEMLTPNHIEPR